MKSLDSIQAQKVLDRAEQLFPDLFAAIKAEAKPDPDLAFLVSNVKQRVVVILSQTATREQKIAAIKQLMRIAG